MRWTPTLAAVRALLGVTAVAAAYGCTGAPATPESSAAPRDAPTAAAAAVAEAPPPPLRVVAVAAGGRTSYALMSDGTVRAWGNGGSGELGDLAIGLATTPIEIAGIAGATSITAGGESEGTACVILEGGAVKCWGGRQAFPLSPGLSGEAMPPTNIDTLAGATDISIGHLYGCAVLANGALRCWGRVPAWPSLRRPRDPEPVPGLQGVTRVRSGVGHVCALMSGGSVSCWGTNDVSQAVPSLPDGYGQTVMRPTAIEGIAGAIDIAVARHFSCAMLADHGVHCWGKRPTRYAPAKSPAGSAYALDVGMAATAFSTGSSGSHVCLLGSAGRARCLGENTYNQLGIEFTKKSETTTPLDVPGLEGIVSLVAAPEHTCAATHDGNAWCWGANRFGGLGDGMATDHTEPAPVAHVTATTLPPLAPPVYPPGFAEDFANLPEGCANETLTFTSDLTERTTFDVRVTHADFSEDRRQLSVYLRTYLFDPPIFAEWVTLPRPGQLAINATFSRVSVRWRRASAEARFMDPSAMDRIERPLKLVPGLYKRAIDWPFEPKPQVQPTVAVHLATDRAMRKFGSIAADVHEGPQQVEVTYLGEDWVCGTLKFIGGKQSLSGRFAAKVHDD